MVDMKPSRHVSNSRRGDRRHLDRGAAAVEMALVLPLLLFIIFGLIDMSRAYNGQVQLSQAAREGARLAALGYSASDITTRVQQAAGVFGSSVTATPTFCPANPGPTDNAKVVVSAPFTWITPVGGMAHFFGASTFPTPTSLSSTGVMQCGG